MSGRYLLDTNTASYVIRGEPPQVRRRLAELPMEAVAISAITEGELRFGAARLPQANALGTLIDAFILRVAVLAWDGAAARAYGRLRAALAAAGTPLGAMDMLIAAHALSTGSILVSSDRAFQRAGGLAIEDWA